MLEKDFFIRYYQAYASENPDALGEFYADDVTLTSSQGVVNGKQAMLDTYKYITSLFVDRMTPDQIIIDGERAAIEITDRFTAKVDVASFLGRAFVEGEQFELKICGIYRVVDGKISTIRIYAGG